VALTDVAGSQRRVFRIFRLSELSQQALEYRQRRFRAILPVKSFSLRQPLIRTRIQGIGQRAQQQPGQESRAKY
jgi:hypothetical protein